MVWYRDVSEWGRHPCWYAVHQSLPTFPEISAHVLEIAALGVVPDPVCDSCGWDWTSASVG